MDIEDKYFPIDSLHFELTNRCNLNCVHCYNNSGSHFSQKENMTIKRWIDFSNYLVKKGGVYETILSGGEPFLLGDAVLDIMDILNEGRDKKRWFYLLTNGFYLTDERIEKLSKYRYHWLQISIDGASATYHDGFRKMQGSWERAVKAAKKVALCGIPLKIAHCVTPYNINEVDEMCELAYSLGASEIVVGGISHSGRAYINTDYLLDSKDKDKLRIKVEDNISKFHNRMIVKTTNSVRDGLERHRKNPKSCAVIRPNGDIRIDGMAPFVVGNVISDDFYEVWNNKIDKAWKNEKVVSYINRYDENSNNELINYITKDIILE